jgi:GntR family transcriptional regulator / MocR family aminotransferase
MTKAIALLQWAQQTGAIIIEDDYDSEYRYGGKPMPALQGLDSSGSVIYMGTFSKVLFPSLRIGYLVLPPQLVPLIAQAKWLSDRQLPMLEQKVLADFIEAGHLESHIRKMRSHYDQRRQVLVQALQQHFCDQVTILGEKAGIHVMVRFSLDLSGAEIMARSLEAGVGIVPASPCYLADGGDREFILGYGELEEVAIVQGIQRLAIALQRC